MTTTIDSEKIIDFILSLPRSKREEIVNAVLQSFAPPTAQESDAEWLEEMKRRIAAVESGDYVAHDWRDVMRDVRTSLAQRKQS